jgi:hypothetical protein
MKRVMESKSMETKATITRLISFTVEAQHFFILAGKCRRTMRLIWEEVKRMQGETFGHAKYACRVGDRITEQ